MTKSYLIYQLNQNQYESWEKSIIAPKFNLKNFVGELHYYIRIYIKKEIPFLKSLMFLFLNITQRMLYTYGTFLINLKYSRK